MFHNDRLTFGEILHQFRKKARLTQQQLADALGMHRHAITRWEQGEVLPGSRVTVLEMIRILRLDDQEARSLLEASFTGPAPLWGVPLARNPFFTGREALIETLQISLQATQKIEGNHAFALQGMGGVGKTQLALEYAYRFALFYHAIFWIEAETQESIIFSLQRIAELLGLPEESATNQQRLIEAVQRWLNTHEQWLLIWDNLEEVELASRIFPRGWQGTFLLTTRLQSLGTLAQGINLGPMEQEEAILFLLRRAKKLAPASTAHLQPQDMQTLAASPEAVHLVSLLGGLPLAIDQAGAYIEETGCSLNDYLRHYTQQSAILLDRRGTPRSEHPHSVTTTFRLSFARLEREQQEAAELLRASAFFHPEAIPEELFCLPGAPLGDTLASLGSDPTRFDLALATLRSLSLIQRHAETHTLSLHRLVQVVLREDIEQGEVQRWRQRVIHALNTAWPEETVTTWAQCERYLAHALACFPWIRAQENAGPEAGALLLKAGTYLIRRGRLDEAEPVAELASALSKHYSSPHDPKRVPFLMLQAELAWRLAWYPRAEQLLFEVLEIEGQHPDFKQDIPGETLNDLGLLYWEQGKYALAEPLFLQVLALQEKVLGLNHFSVAAVINNLAILYWKQGKYALAESAYRQTLRIKEEVLTPLHPELALTLSNLAALCSAQESYEEALALFERALHIQEQVLGPDHPDLGNTLVGIAIIYSHAARNEEAEQLFLRALRIREQVLGPDHPNVAHTLNGLGRLYTSLGREQEAEHALQRALHIREQVLGTEHPDFAISLVDLAMLRAKQGKDEQAQALFQRALQIQTRVLDPMNLSLARSLQGLADLAAKQGRDEQAELLYKRARSIRLQHRQASRMETRNTLEALTQLRASAGDKQ